MNNKHVGSSFDDFLEEVGLLALERAALALGKLLQIQLV